MNPDQIARLAALRLAREQAWTALNEHVAACGCGRGCERSRALLQVAVEASQDYCDSAAARGAAGGEAT